MLSYDPELKRRAKAAGDRLFRFEIRPTGKGTIVRYSGDLNEKDYKRFMRWFERYLQNK